LVTALLLAAAPAAAGAAGVALQAVPDSGRATVTATAVAADGGALQPTAPRGARVADDGERGGIAGYILAALARLEQRLPWSGIPMVRDVPAGPRVVPAGDTTAGPVASRDGPLDVYGVVKGDAVAYEGDVILHPGALVTGDAIAVLGRVRLLGGAVGGDVRSVRGSLARSAASQATAAAVASEATVRGRLELVVGWLTVLILIGVGVLVFASGPLEGVVESLQGGFARSLLLGLVGQLAVLPAILLVVVALAVTVIGILLIPFAIVAIALATAGLMMLGFLAVTRATGGALTGGDRHGRLSERGAALRALVVGITLFVGTWLAAALLTPLPAAAAIARAVAFILTWVAVTAGFGAALRSRAGTRRPAPPEPEPEEEISWQTPTPIGGVVAARRPSSSVR
ncbi:MAG: hypothetical protein ACYC2G_17805, partial [Gemmatimonadaceae bacterium]